MMKVLISVFILLSFFSQSQKQGCKWYFGDKVGLDFINGAPFITPGGQTGTDTSPGWQEGTASIADSNGALLFYTSGKTIWNRFHQPMTNGTGMMGGTSSTQAALIVPHPGNDSLFYVFTSDEFQTLPNSKGYRYSIVNMCLSNGLGAVVSGQKNILLMDSCTEKLAACIDQAGTGYWVLGHKMFSDEFRAWHLTSAGISSIVSSHVGTIHGYHYPTFQFNEGAAQGQMKISPQANRVALAISNFDPGYVDYFNFNNATGIVSNPCHMVIDSAIGGRAYGIEFSPDGSKLYVCSAGGSGSKIYHHDLNAGSCTAVNASRAQVSFTPNGVAFGLQLAPDNKIYAMLGSYYHLCAISFPNLAATTCGFNFAVLSLNYHYGLPSFIAGYQYKNKIVDCSPDLTGLQQNATAGFFLNVFPNPSKHGIQIICGETMEEIVVRDALSRIVFKDNPFMKEKDLEIDLPGVYFISCIANGQTHIQKLVIQD